MSYKLTVQMPHGPHTASPAWDVLPIAKLTATDAEITQPVFAQAALCFIPGDGLHVRMWAFETREAEAPETSALSALFAPGGRSARDYILVRFSRAGTVLAYTVTKDAPPAAVDTDGLRLSPFEGEDLQGAYWGGMFVLPQGLLRARFDVGTYRGGECIAGNLLHESSAGGYPEFAALYPAARGDILSPEHWGHLEFVAY